MTVNPRNQGKLATSAPDTSRVMLGRFDDHNGFDGEMLGNRGRSFHFEFTRCRTLAVQPSPTSEDLLVFYIPDPEAWGKRYAAMRDAGFTEVEAFHPYRRRLGRTFADPDGYQVVIHRTAWSDARGA